MNHRDALQRLVWAILQPLHRSGIHTLEMQPWSRKIRPSFGPTVITVPVQLVAPEKDMMKALRMGAQMEQWIGRAFNLRPGVSWPVRVTASGQYLLVEIPKGEQAWRPTYPELASQATDALLLGVDMHNQVVGLDLTQEFAGAFVVGRSGSGKTNLMRLVAAQAVNRGWELWLADLKGGRDWTDFKPHAAGRFARDGGETVALLARLVEVVARRNRGEADPDPWLLLVVDEVESLSGVEQNSLAQLARQGRSAHLRTLVGNQRCGSGVHPQVRANLAWRITGQVESATESHLATGVAGAGAETLQKLGDMLLVEDGKEVRRFQAARADVEDVAGLLTVTGTTTTKEEETRTDVREQQTVVVVPTSVWEVWQQMEQEAKAANDGRTVPDPWIIARATEYTMRNGTVPTFALVTEWSRRRMGKGLSTKRREEVRQWARRLASQASQAGGGAHAG